MSEQVEVSRDNQFELGFMCGDLCHRLTDCGLEVIVRDAASILAIDAGECFEILPIDRKIDSGKDLGSFGFKLAFEGLPLPLFETDLQQGR